MTIKNTSKRQKGVGLIEVLIAAVVIATGLLALASLQGKLMLSSSQSKTRAEAQVLAEQKIEELRNNVREADYNLIAEANYSDPANPIHGTNAEFERSWTIAGGNAPEVKSVSVTVGWDSNADGTIDDTDEHVDLVSEFAWIDPAKSALYAATGSGGVGAVPSPRQNASEDVASENVDLTRPTPLPGTATATLDAGGNLPATISVVGDGGVNYTLTPITSDSPATHFYAAAFGDGIIGVYLCDDAGNCKYIQNHFGGVALRIAGTVYSTSANGLNHILVAWTSSEVHACYNGPVTRHPNAGALQYYSKPYECVFAGNCNATANGANYCYPDADVSDAQINSRNVGPGGEYGDVGLLGVIDQTGGGEAREQVCFLEDTVDPATSPLLAVSQGSDVINENYRSSVTKRFYATRQISNDGDKNTEKSQGINRSYTNHNFLIVERGTGQSRNQICQLAATQNSIPLAPSEISRVLNENQSNTVLAATTFSNTAANQSANTLTGDVTGSATKLHLYIPHNGACHLNNNGLESAATAYACAVAADAPIGNDDIGVDIYGGSNEHPTADPGQYALCNKKNNTTCNWLNNFATSAPVGSCTSPWGSSILNGESVTAYSAPQVEFGSDCATVAATLTCTDGTLSDNASTYFYESCIPAASADCSLDGTNIANGSTITAYQTATVPHGQLCQQEERTCTNGILSGSYQHTSCAAQNTREISVTISKQGTGSLSNVVISGDGANCVGNICTVAYDWTGVLTASATCSGSPASVSGSVNLDATATLAEIQMESCAGPACNQLPWVSVSSGGNVNAYETASVNYPANCRIEQRFCNDGQLSGSFTHQNCATVCTVPNLVGMPTQTPADLTAVNNKIIAAGFVANGTKVNTGNNVVQTQSVAAGATPACGTTIGFTYK